MRTLNYRETSAVAGGLGEDDGSAGNVEIVVYGTRQFDYSIYTNSFGKFADIDSMEDLLDPDLIPDDANSACILPAIIWAEIIVTTGIAVVGWIISKIFDDSQRIEAERNIGDKFLNSTTVRIDSTSHGPAFLQSDGWYYFDVNGNGKLDARAKAGPNGSVIIDDGQGVRIIDPSRPLSAFEPA